jgi:maltooligosyltrehalose trehalohydrolase
MNCGLSETFKVWAPTRNTLQLHIVSPAEQAHNLIKDESGYFHLAASSAPVEGTRYFLNPDGIGDLPDPRSHYQPEGVHGPTEYISHNFSWGDQAWKGRNLSDLIIYELHVGTFTREGTFDAIIPRLPQLAGTGINAIQLMPLSQFPGERNWGYDGVFHFAVQNSYGGPYGLKRFVDECHRHEIAVILDVVYNHMGPEGNHLKEFGPYFTGRYHTPWGDAFNFDGEWSDGVREYVLDNVEHWFVNYHIDGLRLDAVHAIHDSNAMHILSEVNARKDQLIGQLGRNLFLIAESDLNDPKVIRSSEVNGYGFDAQWLDDFHHALYTLVDPKGRERYSDFGHIEQLAKAINHGFVSSGEYVAFRKRRYGASSAGISGDKFVVFTQNHDQIGNRIAGERSSMLVGIDQLKLSAAVMLLSPYVPMLFMGEEYGEEAPFLYFISHSDSELINAVREGRKEEFAAFNKTTQEPPDPFEESTFDRCKLNWQLRTQGKHGVMLEWHRVLIAVRRHPAMRNFEKAFLLASVVSPTCMTVFRQTGDGKSQLFIVYNFGEEPARITLPFPRSFKMIDSTEDIQRDALQSEGCAAVAVMPYSCQVWSNEEWPAFPVDREAVSLADRL